MTTTNGGPDRFVPQATRRVPWTVPASGQASPPATPHVGVPAAPPPPVPDAARPAAGAWVDGAEERVAAELVDARRHAQELAALRDDMDAVRGAARSPGGDVGVEVDARGRLVRLRLTDGACALRPAGLARLVEDTARAAAAAADRSAVALVEERFGQGSAIAAAVREDLTPPTARR